MMHDRFPRKEREKLIIQSAKEVFIDKGYTGATTQELAKKANISEVTLFRYFPSKSHLFNAVITEAITSFEKMMEKEILEKELIKPLLEDRIRYVLENQNLIKLVLIEKELNSALVENIEFPEIVFHRLDSILLKMNISENKREVLLRIISGFLISLVFFPPDKATPIGQYMEEIMRIIECNKKLP